MSADAPLILFAEDDPDDRMLLQEACDEDPRDYRVAFVEDGEALLEELERLLGDDPRTALPHLVVLDLNMPRMDGREALAAIRRHPQLQTLRVVVFTTSNAPTDITRCYELGADSFVIKPSSFDELVATVQTISHYWLDVVQPPHGDPRT